MVSSPTSTLELLPTVFGMSSKPATKPHAPAKPAVSKTAKGSAKAKSHGAAALVGLSRKNKPQRCSICKECGHKSRTCRWAQAGKVEVEVRPPSQTGFTATSLLADNF